MTPRIIVVRNEIADLSTILPADRKPGDSFLLAKVTPGGGLGDCAIVEVVKAKGAGNVLLLGGQKDAVAASPVINALGALVVEQDLRLARIEVKLGLRADEDVARASDPLSPCLASENRASGKERPS